MKRKYLIITIVLNFTFFFSFAQQDCTSALPVCSDANSGGLVDGYGSDDFNGATSSGCLNLGLGVSTIETNSYWFKIRMAASGEFGFTITPNDASEDWDFAVYGPNANCGSLGDPIACNFSKVSPSGYTGVGRDPSSNTQTDAYDDWMNVNAGEEYLIMINQYSGSNAGFKINWEGAAIANNTDPLDCSILVDLGPDRVLCDGDSTTLNATIFGSSVAYLWRYFDTNTNNFEVFSPSQTGATLDVTTSGRFSVEVTDLNTSDIREDDIEITFTAVPVAGVPNDIYLCDNDNDGFENFDLESRTAQIINGQINMAVTYHEFDLFAEVGADPQASPYFSDSRTIWARIYNVNNPECYDITSFELVAAGQLLPNQPPDLSACDNDTDGETYFDLDAQTSIILGGQTGFVTYYESESLAEDRKGWILDTNAYLTPTRTIWARVEINPGSDCFEILRFEINVSVLPEIFIAEDILECDDDNDGIGTFNLNDLKDLEIAGHQNLNDFDIFYYTSPFDADDDVNRIEQPYVTQTPYAAELIYARIQAANVPECFQVSSFTIQVFDNPSPTPSDEMTSLSYCDDISDGDDTNGLYNFDLTEKATEILNGQSPFVFTIEYYQDVDYMIQIPDPTNYMNSTPGGETIYVRVLNGNPNNVYCLAETSFFAEVRPLPRAMDTTYTLMQCDEDASPDGIANFKLSEADDFIRLGDETLIVSYHLTNADAHIGSNSIDKNSFSNSIASNVFARVTALNACYRIVDVNLETSITEFPPNYLRRFEVCDGDAVSDGKSIFNLTSATSEIISLFNSQNLRVSFYRNEDDALAEVNEIAEPTLYENEIEFFQVVWVRVESALDGGCFGIGPVIELVVNRRPNFELIESAFVCLDNTPLNVTVENPEGSYTYTWTNQNGEVISLIENAQIYEAGTYTVVATSIAGCDSFPQQVEVTASEIPNFLPEDITVVDNSEINSITIRNNGNLGVGDYEFSLDDIDGFYQDENEFYNVIPGRHTVYIRDKNGCGIAQQVVHVLGFPKFFTPNADGVNDYWNVLGINSVDYPEVIVYIFDRHGKHLTTIDGNSIGWNGIYNGSKSISTDYWYLAELTDSGGNRSQYKGHFSLIRR